MAKAAEENALEATTGRVVATSEDRSIILTDMGDDDPIERPYEGDPLAQFSGVIVPMSGEGRDFDPVATGCPACQRGAPRRGALHDCGRSNAGFDGGRHAI
jgi:hypothetical protein